MKQISNFLAFVKKNRVIIYSMLACMLVLQICSEGSKPPVNQVEEVQEVISLNEGGESVEQGERVEQPPSRSQDYTNILLMTILVLSFFVAKRYGWLEKIFPSIVVFQVNHFKQKSTGNHVLKIAVINKTSKDVSLMQPTIVFYKGNKSREFAIKNIGGLNYFPLTLLPNTGQKFTIDAEKFYNNVEGLKEFKTIQVKMCSTGGKCYKSMKWPKGLTFRKL